MVSPHNEIILYGFGEAFGTADVSPFVTKVEILLKMAGLAYRIDTSKRPSQGPKKKLPYIEDNGRAVGDSTLIRFYLENVYGVDFDKNVSDIRIASAYMAEKYIEHDFYYSALHNRWMDDENYTKRIKPFFAGIPALIRPVILRTLRRSVRKTLYRQGTGRLSQEEREILAVRAFSSLDALLGDAPYFGGDVTCGSDASIAAFLAGTMTPAFHCPYISVVKQYPRLITYAQRMMQRYHLPYPQDS